MHRFRKSVLGLLASVAVLTLVSGLARAQGGAFPDPLALLREIEANQQKMDEIRETFAFHRTQLFEDLDKGGRVVKTYNQEREIFFIHGQQVGRLVKVNGVPLNANQEQAERARITRQIEVLMMTATKPRKEPGQANTLAMILAVANISNPRRVRLRGRPTLAYDFIGDRNAHARGIVQSAFKKAAGTIWFDEGEQQVARLEVTLAETYRFGWFLANIRKGTQMVEDQSPVGQGLWMPSSVDEHVDSRTLTSFERRNFHEEDFGFRKFDIREAEKILLEQGRKETSQEKAK